MRGRAVRYTFQRASVREVVFFPLAWSADEPRNTRMERGGGMEKRRREKNNLSLITVPRAVSRLVGGTGVNCTQIPAPYRSSVFHSFANTRKSNENPKDAQDYFAPQFHSADSEEPARALVKILYRCLHPPRVSPRVLAGSYINNPAADNREQSGATVSRPPTRNKTRGNLQS